MSGQETGFIRQAQDLRPDTLQQLAIIPAGQIGAPDTASEDRIPTKDHLFGCGVEHDMSGRVTRNMPNFEAQAADLSTTDPPPA